MSARRKVAGTSAERVGEGWRLLSDAAQTLRRMHAEAGGYERRGWSWPGANELRSDYNCLQSRRYRSTSAEQPYIIRRVQACWSLNADEHLSATLSSGRTPGMVYRWGVRNRRRSNQMDFSHLLCQVLLPRPSPHTLHVISPRRA